MPKISAVIITYNEEKYIEQCINSLVDVADEIVVVDSLSTDRTVEICKRLGAKIIEQKFLGYKEQKNFAVQQAEYDYILSLDADEALSAELRKSILKAKNNWLFDGYRFNRLNNFCGQWMHHTSLYPERKLRLFDRRKGEWGGINPHDKFIMHLGATTGYLKGDLLHWAYDSIEEHIAKINHFSSISAKEYHQLGIKAGIGKTTFRPIWRFFHSFVIKTGFLDGYMGFIVSLNLAYLCFLKYAKLRRLILTEKNNKKNRLTDTRVKVALQEWDYAIAGQIMENNTKPTYQSPIQPENISIIISTYNQPEWLQKVLWGFKCQTLSGFEIVIADDGSDAETKAIINGFKENSKLNITHVWHEHQGFRKCQILNKAIIASRGDYLIFTDGDCIPQEDFIEIHAKRAKKGFFLSGGYFKLNLTVSNAITQQDILMGNPFSTRWLLKNGQPFTYKYLKLYRNSFLKWFMNTFTPTRATWNGHNSSGWKEDIVKVNGYNEDMQYGGLDRELGERLKNTGLKSKQIRYSAICVHLDHPRPYKTKDTLLRNIRIRREVKRTKLTWTEKGISNHIDIKLKNSSLNS
ncbi:MAG TPA: glycosyltransferase [Tenuifilaceae bacterium]|jgi:glycosyltransferase involved in cell wall biosynthesis|nr:glycosyltransferase [Bacteroidales bacterium]OQC64508.1 MAG: Chondroitin synthase [Bacteroidetes bacterium ADurb.Bin008]HOF90877.1 glycosyltransferase [Tenuifilaceae bacterium]HOM84810.1 glycosyltransferase [Tenuifilaceae bacterium]HOQ34353.1 glycosyltransferase [Tenuifilaceae bacterium]